MLASILDGKMSKYLMFGLVILSAAMSLLYFFEKSSHRATVQEFAIFKEKTRNLGELAKVKKAEEEARQEFVTNTIVNSHENSIDQLKDYYAKNPVVKYIRVVDSLQNNNPSCSGMPAETASAASIETENAGIAETSAPDIEAEIYDINAKRLSYEVVQCLELVEWVNRQGF